MPHRKVIREWLVPLSERVTLRALLLLAMDFAIWAALLTGTVLFEAWWAKLLCAVAMGFTIGRLFIIGHDACHQSLTPHRGLNKWVGRIAFLPSLTTFSLWDIGHNVVHHGYTNLKGFDFVWAPLTREEFAKLSFAGRMLDRAYRSGWAKAQPFVSTTVHLTFPFNIGSLMHHIMEHTAHHVDMSIPLYRLKLAQAKLENLLPGRIIVQRFSWGWYFQTARSCKLYDFTRQCWTDYKGRATSQPALIPA